MTKPPLKAGNADDFQTPPIALAPLLPYLKKDWHIWECAVGKGNLSIALMNEGFKVTSSDKEKNFLAWSPPKFDCIITNPPYSLKENFLERCYQLRKPFALLMPLTALEGKKRQVLYKKYGVEIIFFNKRINFETPSGNGTGSWFATAWFTNGLKIGRQLTFVDLTPIEQKKLCEVITPINPYNSTA